MDGMDPTVAKSEKHCGTRNQCQNCSPNQGALSRLETLQRIEGGKTAYTGWYARTLFFFPVFRAHRPLSHERDERVRHEFRACRPSFDMVEDRQHLFCEAFAET